MRINTTRQTLLPAAKHLQNNETKRQLSLVSCSAGLGGRAGAGCLLWLNHHPPEAPSTCAACTQGPGQGSGDDPLGSLCCQGPTQGPSILLLVRLWELRELGDGNASAEGRQGDGRTLPQLVNEC